MAKKPLDSRAVSEANQQFYKNNPDRDGKPIGKDEKRKRKEWWKYYKEAAAKKKTPPPKKDAPVVQKKKPGKAAQPCPMSNTCVIDSLEVKCEDVPAGKRSYVMKLPAMYTPTTNTNDPPDILEVISGTYNTPHKIHLKTKVLKPLCAKKHSSDHFTITSSHLKRSPVIKKGPEGDFKVCWPHDVKQWYRYLWPFSLKPAIYKVSADACTKPVGLAGEVHVYPDVQITASFDINLTKDKSGARGKANSLEGKIGGVKFKADDVLAKARMVLDIIMGCKRVLKEVNDIVSVVSPVTLKPNWPVAGISLSLSNEEHPTRYCTRLNGKMTISGKPLIGLKVQGDVIDGVLKVAAVLTGPGAPLVLLINYGRKKLGAGIYISCDGNIKGVISHTIKPWPRGKQEGKLGGEIVMTLEGRVAKEGGNFICRFLSKVRVGGTGAVELMFNKLGADKKGWFVESEAKFTGVFLYYGAVKTKKSMIEYNHSEHGSKSQGGVMILKEKQFWKDKRWYVWSSDDKKPVSKV